MRLKKTRSRFNPAKPLRRSRGPWKPWDIRKSAVSPSFVATFQQCRNQAKLTYVDGWHAPFGSNLPIEFGQMVHAALENAFRCVAPPALDTCRGWVNDYLNANPAFRGRMIDPELTYWPEIAAYMVWKFTRLPRTFYRYETETVYEEHRLDTHYEYPDGFRVRLSGVIDTGYALKPPQTRVIIGDYKTKGRIEDNLLDSELESDFQTNFYAFYHWLETASLPFAKFKEIIRRPGLKDFNVKRTKGDIDKRTAFYFKRFRRLVTWERMHRWIVNDFHPVMADIRLWSEGFGDWYSSKARCRWTNELIYPDAPRTPNYTNPYGLTFGYRRVDLYDALTANDFTGLDRRT